MEFLLSAAGGLAGIAYEQRLAGLLECGTALQRWAHRFRTVLIAALVPALVYHFGAELLDRHRGASLLGALGPTLHALRVAGMGVTSIALFRARSHQLGCFLLLAWVLPTISTHAWLLAVLGVDSLAATSPSFCEASLCSAAAWTLASQLVGVSARAS
jgi:hypothetical protein